MLKRLKSLSAPAEQIDKEVPQRVSEILSRIRAEGDSALNFYNAQFDGLVSSSPIVTEDTVKQAYRQIPQTAVLDLRFAANNIREFAKRQLSMFQEINEEILPGVVLGHRIIPLDACAGYVPGGRYPLPSSALMSIIPAKVAGVKRVLSCSPKSKQHASIHPATLVAMDIAGADEIYCMGGAQAIAALAYGTKNIKPVNLIAGPGNQYVTEAKKQVSGFVGIDFLAGPSEVLIIADRTASPEVIAADLLAQSEHDPLARGLLFCTDEELAKAVITSIDESLAVLPTKDVACDSWNTFGEIVLFDSLEEAAIEANKVAPEHLEIQVANPEHLVPMLTNYGSLFIGEGSAEAFGDYSAGTNHILPTNKAARYTGGVWVGTFLKVVSHQRISKEGAKLIGPVASRLAELEGLYGHKLAADVRVKNF